MTDSISYDSRRASPRVACRWRVRCVTEQKKVFETKVINISLGGLLVITPVSFAKGDRLYLEVHGFSQGQSHIVKVVGETVYFSIATNNQAQLGLQYVSDLSLADHKFIQQYVKLVLG